MDPTERNVEIAVELRRAVMLKWMQDWPQAVGRYLGTLARLHRTDDIFVTLEQLKARPELAPYVRDAIFGPSFRDFWRDPRSMRVAAQLGVLQYWRSTGNWPDFCFEPNFPYNCKTEAAKVAGNPAP